MDFKNEDYWKAIILYGLNNATYKIALGKTLLDLSDTGSSHISWDLLSKAFLDNYIDKLKGEVPLPQQTNPARQTVVERIVAQIRVGRLNYAEAIEQVGRDAFNDVIPRFHSIGADKELARNRFYEIHFGKKIILRDELMALKELNVQALYDELNARWNLLEGAFSINKNQSVLTNDDRLIYLQKGYARTNLTNNIPFLDAYQGNVCFYCGEEIMVGDIHVDHVLPRQVLHHDEIWNLVLSHSYCNAAKSDRVVSGHYINKLIQRNENIMGSNHPWKQKIELQLGKTMKERSASLSAHYEKVKSILGTYYWGGIEDYVPENDPFFKKLITKLNNG
jgi:hypothetical protein